MNIAGLFFLIIFMIFACAALYMAFPGLTNRQKVMASRMHKISRPGMLIK